MRRLGFTILELLATTALTALLMVSVLHIVGTLGRSRQALARQTETGAIEPEMVDLLRRDLSNASQIRFDPSGITLTGNAAIDRGSLSHHQEPVTIGYGLSTIDGRRWLVRTQVSRFGDSEGRPWAELVAADVSSFDVRPSSPLPVGSETTGPSAQPVAMPNVVIVRMTRSDGRTAEQTLVLR